MPVYCAVCKKEIYEGGRYFYHSRLDAYIHPKCPLTNVWGENLEGHAMIWGRVE